jgi:non-heme chloroperoxidase
VPFTLGEIQNKMIRNSTLIPFEFSGHASFIDQMDRFNKELARFIES